MTVGMINSIAIDKLIGVAAYASDETPTVVTTAATYYPIANAFTNVYAEGFTAVATPAIRYDGTRTMVFEIDWHATLISETNGTTIEIGFKKGANIVTGSTMCVYCKTATEQFPLSGTMVVELALNDTIQLVLTADKNDESVIVKHFTTTIRPFFF